MGVSAVLADGSSRMFQDGPFRTRTPPTRFVTESPIASCKPLSLALSGIGVPKKFRHGGWIRSYGTAWDEESWDRDIISFHRESQSSIATRKMLRQWIRPGEMNRKKMVVGGFASDNAQTVNTRTFSTFRRSCSQLQHLYGYYGLLPPNLLEKSHLQQTTGSTDEGEQVVVSITISHLVYRPWSQGCFGCQTRLWPKDLKSLSGNPHANF
jgi:hypothetical protein